jgi:hypothetical protein
LLNGVGVLDLLHEWQELSSGVLALVAGAFIFLQGALERRVADRARLEDSQKEVSKNSLILDRLNHACVELAESIERAIESLEDVLSAIDRGDQGVDLPSKIVIPKVFEVIFAQLTTRDIPIHVYLELSLLLERGSSIEEDFRRFFVSYGQTVTDYRAAQQRLPFASAGSRLASEEPVAQTLLISMRALHEVVNDLDLGIRVELNGGNDGGDFRPGYERLGPVQSVKDRAQIRQGHA